MQIEFKLNGKKEKFTIGYVNMLAVRRAMEINENISDFNNPTSKELDKMIDFIVDTFEDQFTRNDFYKGYPAKGFVKSVMTILNDITSLLIDTADDMGE